MNFTKAIVYMKNPSKWCVNIVSGDFFLLEEVNKILFFDGYCERKKLFIEAF